MSVDLIKRIDARIPTSDEMRILLAQFISEKDVYGSLVDVVAFVINDNGDIEGIFKADQKPDGYFFSINNDGLGYIPIASLREKFDSHLSSYLKNTEAYKRGFSRSRIDNDQDGNKGYPCKRGHISKDKECRTGGKNDPEKQKRIEQLREAAKKNKKNGEGKGGNEDAKKLMKDERVKRLLQYMKEQGDNFAIEAAAKALGLPVGVVRFLVKRVLSVFGCRTITDLVGKVFNFIKRLFGFGGKKEENQERENNEGEESQSESEGGSEEQGEGSEADKDRKEDSFFRYPDIYTDAFMRGYFGRS